MEKKKKLTRIPKRHTIPALKGTEIKRRRMALGLTMEQAADAAGIKGRQSWYRLESGIRNSVSLGTIVALARVLKCRVDDLLEIEP